MSEQVSCADVPDLLSETADVIVVGAGPAGSSVASHLAKAGLDVLLLEKTRFPREKACGDGLTPRAVRALTAMGVPIAERDGWPRGTAGIVASVVGVNDNAVPLMLALHGAPGRERRGALAEALRDARRDVADDPFRQATGWSFITLGAWQPMTAPALRAREPNLTSV